MWVDRTENITFPHYAVGGNKYCRSLFLPTSTVEVTPAIVHIFSDLKEIRQTLHYSKQLHV